MLFSQYGVAVKLAAAKMEIEGYFKICDVGLTMCNFPLFDRYEIVEGVHELWDGVSGPYRETIRAFLIHFQSQVYFLSGLFF